VKDSIYGKFCIVNIDTSIICDSLMYTLLFIICSPCGGMWDEGSEKWEVGTKEVNGEIVINIKHHDKGMVVSKILAGMKNPVSLAICDGGNDLPMLGEVTYPILYNPKDRAFPSYKGLVVRDWGEVLGYVIPPQSRTV